MFAGAYWGKRPETREHAARRLLMFLESVGDASEALATWYPKLRRKSKGGQRPILLSATELAEVLRSNRRDLDGTAIDKLGFNVGLWNGDGVSVSATIGSYDEFVSNSVLLAVESGAEPLSEDAWRRVLEAMKHAFDPERAAVASTEKLTASPVATAWEVGWITYRRGDPRVVEHPERR
jgi:hypothetical protein